MQPGELWQRFHEQLYFHEGLGLYLDASRMLVDALADRGLRAGLERAFAQMAELERGALANVDEQRLVGHYWLRDPALAPSDELRLAITDGLARVERFARCVHSGSIATPDGERFSDVLAIGIGGSALGPQLLVDALALRDAPIKLHFLDNTDPQGMDRVLASLGHALARTLVIETSKSGSTPETRNGMLEVAEAFARAGLELAPRAVAITSEGSALDAQAHDWLARFPMYDWVGGRFSVTSAVGLLPAALQGIDVHALLDGAREMDVATRATDPRANPAAVLAAHWHAAGNGRGAKDMVVLPYKDSLLLYSRYLQQLVMESLGKGRDLDGRAVEQGIAVYGNKGSTDQHAYVQQLREGVSNFFVTFIEVLEDRDGDSIDVEPGITSGDYLNGFLYGTREALHANGRGSITISIPRVDARRLGALIALYERAVGYYATLVNINAYHQPGVEAGKKAAGSRLALQRRIVDVLAAAGRQALELSAIARAAGAPDQVEAVYQILRHLEANGRGVELLGERGRPSTLRARCAERGGKPPQRG
jgi:glucose-6-phosphate isomerase